MSPRDLIPGGNHRSLRVYRSILSQLELSAHHLDLHLSHVSSRLDAEGVRLRVEDPLVERQHFVLAEEQVEVLEGLRHPEARHRVLVAARPPHVSQGRVARRGAALLLQREEDLPAPLAPGRVVREAPHEEETLYGLGPQRVLGLRD
eukprot:scaffold36873_cov78-Phaeocystis_antarctica.AAC.14